MAASRHANYQIAEDNLSGSEQRMVGYGKTSNFCVSHNTNGTVTGYGREKVLETAKTLRLSTTVCPKLSHNDVLETQNSNWRADFPLHVQYMYLFLRTSRESVFMITFAVGESALDFVGCLRHDSSFQRSSFQ